MTGFQHIIIIAMCVLGTVLMRALPFAVFATKGEPPRYIRYLGKVLPAAIFSMLVVYCLKGVNVFAGSHAIPELIALCVVVLLHLWRRNMMLSIASGTVVYMILVQVVFG